MPKIDPLPTKKPDSYSKQLILSIVVIILVGITFIIFSKVILGVIIALLGAVFGVGMQVGKGPLNKD